MCQRCPVFVLRSSNDSIFMIKPRISHTDLSLILNLSTKHNFQFHFSAAMVTFESEQDHCYWYIGGGTGVKEQRSMDAVIAQPLHESVSRAKNK